jgi:hypothetical protein
MAVDTLFVSCGVYASAPDALADYDFVKEIHSDAELIDSYDAAVIERDHSGRIKIVRSTRPRHRRGADVIGSFAPLGRTG